MSRESEGAEDARLDPIRSFTVKSFRLDPDKWREFVLQDETAVTFSSFCSSQDVNHLFLCQRPDSGLSVSLDFPREVHSKVICVSRTLREGVTRENARNILTIQEVQGGDALSFIVDLTEEVSCTLLSNSQSSCSWEVGVADEALRFLQKLKNEALLMKAQVDGHTFLAHPDALCRRGGYNDAGHQPKDVNQSGGLRDKSLAVDNGDQKSDIKLLHACNGTIVEWAELVSEFLQQDWSRPVLDGLKPLPLEEFDFWKNRLKNLHSIQQQLTSPRAQQVASILQTADSVYWSTLRDIYKDVQDGLQEAEDVTVHLVPVQEKLEEVMQLQYHQLKDHMVSVTEEVRQLWIKSEFYRQPCRIVVLLQEICNSFIQLSREFLRGQEVMIGLVLDHRLVLKNVCLVIQTLQALKEAYVQTRIQTYNQDTLTHSWDFPSNLVFFHLDKFLKRLHNIQEVFSISLQLYQLDQMVLSGVSGRIWTDVVQEVYQDFLVHVRLLSDCNCDPTDPEDQTFELHRDQFQVQVSDLKVRLVSVLSRALEDCNEHRSAAKLVKMFGFILDHPLIRDQLHPHLTQLVQMVLMDLDQIHLLFSSEKEKVGTLTRFTPPAVGRLQWTQQLRLRAEDALKSFRAIQHLDLDSGDSQLVLQRFEQIMDTLQVFRDTQRSDWSTQLESDCEFILKHPVIGRSEQGVLEVSCSQKVEALLTELRYVSRERDVELCPHTTKLVTCRDDITQSYQSLTHMVSCYNQVVNDALQVDHPLIEGQLQDLNQNLLKLQKFTWGSDVQKQVQQQTQSVLNFHSTVREARANTDAMTCIIQGWAGLHLLERSGDSLLKGGAAEQTCKQLREEGQELLRLIQVNMSLYGAEASSPSWNGYLEHMDDKVQDGLFQLLLRALHFLSDSTSPQSDGAALLAVSLQLQEKGSVFEPSVSGGLSDFLKTIISDVYAAASLLPRISVSRDSDYQVSLQQNPKLSALEQEVMHHLLQVKKETEHMRVGLDRYSHLWLSDKLAAFQEFLSYSRQLGPEEEADETPPTLKDFQREIDSLQTLRTEMTHLDEFIVLHSWLQVDLRPFRDSLLSVIQDWKNMYTEYLLNSVSGSLQQVTQRGAEDEESSSSSSFPLTETILLLEAAAVELPEHMAAQLQC